MDDETPEMEKLTQHMRATMAAWVAEPNNNLLKQQYQTSGRALFAVKIAVQQLFHSKRQRTKQG